MKRLKLLILFLLLLSCSQSEKKTIYTWKEEALSFDVVKEDFERKGIEEFDFESLKGLEYSQIKLLLGESISNMNESAVWIVEDKYGFPEGSDYSFLLCKEDYPFVFQEVFWNLDGTRQLYVAFAKCDGDWIAFNAIPAESSLFLLE